MSTRASVRTVATACVVSVVGGVVLGAFAVAADAMPGALGRILLLVASTGLAWGVAAFALGAWSSSPKVAPLAGGLVMVTAVTAYYAIAVWTGARVASGDVVRTGALWAALGAIVGPALGVLGWHARRATGRRRSVIWGAISGVLLSQGLYLLYRSRGDLFSPEARALWLLLIGSLFVPVAIVIVGSRRRHVGVGLAVSGVIGVLGAAAWVVMFRLLTPA